MLCFLSSDNEEQIVTSFNVHVHWKKTWRSIWSTSQKFTKIAQKKFEVLFFYHMAQHINYFFSPVSPAFTGFLSFPFFFLFTNSFSFSARSKYWTHLARILSFAFSLCASSETNYTESNVIQFINKLWVHPLYFVLYINWQIILAWKFKCLKAEPQIKADQLQRQTWALFKQQRGLVLEHRFLNN